MASKQTGKGFTMPTRTESPTTRVGLLSGSDGVKSVVPQTKPKERTSTETGVLRSRCGEGC